MKRPKFREVGRTTDGKQVIDGAAVFQMVDTRGFPLDLLRLELGDVVFDVRGFICAAYASGNYKPERLVRLLVSEGCLPEDRCRKFVTEIYGQ